MNETRKEEETPQAPPAGGEGEGTPPAAPETPPAGGEGETGAGEGGDAGAGEGGDGGESGQ